MANDSKFDSNSFLGGAGKFNKAGDNVPLPGEKVTDVPTPLPFGGPKIWLSVLLIVVVLIGLFFFYEAPAFKPHPNNRTLIADPSSSPSDNPDASSSNQ